MTFTDFETCYSGENAKETFYLFGENYKGIFKML